MKSIYTTMGYARGLTVLVMPAVHSVMVYGAPSIYHTGLVYVLRFFAEGPGAQLFMFQMGFFLALKNATDGRSGIVRGLHLLLAGYGLNLVRMYLPGRMGWLPTAVLIHYSVVPTADVCLPLLLTGDILQFAGIGYTLISWLQHTVRGYTIYVLLYLGIALTAPLVWGIHSHSVWLDYILGLFCAEDARAFFPVFPWLCYPLAGYITGRAFKPDTKLNFYRLLALPGLLMLLTGTAMKYLEPPSWGLDFYRTSPGMTIAYTGFQMIWVCFIQLCAEYLPSVRLWKELLQFSSKHITAIYLIHWVLIGWGIGLLGYQNLELSATCLALSSISVLSFILTFGYSRVKVRKSAAIPVSRH